MAGAVGSEQGIRQRYEGLAPVLNEQGLRRFAATEARAYGHGGVSVVARITGIARSTIGRGIRRSGTSHWTPGGYASQAAVASRNAQKILRCYPIWDIWWSQPRAGPDATAAVDVEKSATLVRVVARSGPFGLPSRDCRRSARTGIQPAGE